LLLLDLHIVKSKTKGVQTVIITNTQCNKRQSKSVDEH